jgi:hypothetical protein
VPSSQVVVGVTSYGRSFAMAEPGCFTEQCTYTGGQTSSDATPGVCTGQAGYIANAEIQDILNDPSRVVSNYVDQGSNSNILVYDDIQWVGYMDDDIKGSRKALYQSLGFGGTTDWATDLAQYNIPPDDYETWPDFISDVENGIDPENKDVVRTGPWTTIGCDVAAVRDQLYMKPSDRWAQLDADNAWDNCKTQWASDQEQGYITFTASVSNLLHEPEAINCGEMQGTNNCGGTTELCTTTNETGAASYAIYNSLVIVHEVSPASFLGKAKFLLVINELYGD